MGIKKRCNSAVMDNARLVIEDKTVKKITDKNDEKMGPATQVAAAAERKAAERQTEKAAQGGNLLEDRQNAFVNRCSTGFTKDGRTVSTGHAKYNTSEIVQPAPKKRQVPRQPSHAQKLRNEAQRCLQRAAQAAQKAEAQRILDLEQNMHSRVKHGALPKIHETLAPTQAAAHDSTKKCNKCPKNFSKSWTETAKKMKSGPGFDGLYQLYDKAKEEKKLCYNCYIKMKRRRRLVNLNRRRR